MLYEEDVVTCSVVAGTVVGTAVLGACVVTSADVAVSAVVVLLSEVDLTTRYKRRSL